MASSAVELSSIRRMSVLLCIFLSQVMSRLSAFHSNRPLSELLKSVALRNQAGFGFSETREGYQRGQGSLSLFCSPRHFPSQAGDGSAKIALHARKPFLHAGLVQLGRIVGYGGKYRDAEHGIQSFPGDQCFFPYVIYDEPDAVGVDGRYP